MSNKTRKHIWSGALVMSIAIVGVLAAFVVLAGNPATTDAHDGGPAGDHCTGANAPGSPSGHDIFTPADHPKCADDGSSNQAPTAVAGMTLGNIALAPGASSAAMDLSTYFTDPDGDTLMYTATSSAPGVATASVAGSMLTVTAASGAADGATADITVAAGDPDGLTAMQTFTVTVRVPATDMITSDSTSASGSPEIQLELVDIGMALDVGASIVLYLEDDFQKPDSIPASSVYLRVTHPRDKTTGNGGRVYVENAPKIKTSDYFDQDKKDISIRVLVPDMCDDDTAGCEGQDGIPAGADVTLVIESDSGIKNPSEARKPGYHTGYVLLDASAATIPARGNFNLLGDLEIRAKISLSDVDNKRGYEMTVSGSGFNNGTSAGVYVLHYPGADPTDKTTWPSCDMIIGSGTKVGGALVGSDDKAAVTFEVTAPTFRAGKNNYICMVDGEGLASDTDVEDFNLEPSIKVVPSSVAAGDTVNVFAQDYPSSPGGFVELKVGGHVLWQAGATSNAVRVTARSIGTDGSGEVTFEVPGGLEGTLRIDAKWGDTSKDSKISIAGAELSSSKSAVLPNETITITGNGFGSQTCIPTSNITLDNVSVMVDAESISTSGGCKDSSGVEVSNSGQFVATVVLWPAPREDGTMPTNPTLIPGTHELSVEDSKGFGGSVSVTIAEPTIVVTPDVAGPRDYVTITGENWPVDNPDGASTAGIMVRVDDGRVRPYTLFADAVGRVVQEHRVYRNVPIPSDVQVKMTYGDVAKIGSFAVPASTITVTPGEGQPGDTVSLTSGNMPVYSEVSYIEIGGTRYNDPGVNTDRDGNVTVDDVLIPGLDPGVYSIVINVDGTIAIGEVTVLAESSAAGAPAELPGAVENLGDSLVAIFHFDDVGKVWSFYDPRPEFADLNTLTEMVNGEAYWILVSETVEDVVLNNKVRSLTCRGDDCWNLEVW